MRLQSYLDRIQYHGNLMPTLKVLNAIHVAHVCAVPFENIDVQLGRRLTISIKDAYQKIVELQRGGWCYEQNGLFGWALSEIGFQVTRIAASVLRNPDDDQGAANHLCLLVACPGEKQIQYLADVGFGGSMLQPIPLTKQAHNQSPFELGLVQLDDGYWRFQEILNSEAFSFDFLPVCADEHALSNKCDFLQTDPSSNFVQNLVAQQRSIDRHTILRGRVLTHISKDVVRKETLESSDALSKALSNKFGLELPEVDNLWSKICARHDQLFT